MRLHSLPAAGWLALLLILFSCELHAQCGSRPVSLEERVEKSTGIVLGKVTASHCYEDADGNIYTLHLLDVLAWLKNNTGQREVGIITLGGVLENKAQITFPTLQLSPDNEYVIFLEGDNQTLDDKTLRSQRPSLVQSFAYADAQGALTYQRGKYHDLHFHPARNEPETFERIADLTGQAAQTPGGNLFQPRNFEENTPEFFPITAFTPNPTHAGTIAEGDFLNITGSGFGASAGTVFYSNADDGGATFISSGVASDIISWSDTDITSKVASAAGTGIINVNGSQSSASPLTIEYAHNTVNSSFSGWGVTTRQRYYLRNMNGAGGYTFAYNTTSGFSSNNAAIAAFERAMQTWRCETYINWMTSGTTASEFANDNENVVMFDPSLPSGVLVLTTSRFSGAANASCTLANTVWCLEEVDIRFRTTPGTGYSWQFGPALPSSTEYDFETAALHDLGHAHGLGHRIASGDLMYFDIPNGTAIRIPAPAEITGGANKVAYSTTATCYNPTACGAGQMVALTSENCQFLLPVELVHFQAQAQGEVVALRWTTASETQNSHFTIERSNDAEHFLQIGEKAGQGTTSQRTDYLFFDENPLPGLNYYRLKSNDYDGKIHYTPLEVVTMKKQKTTWRIFPNPLQNQAWLEAEAAVSLRLLDVCGREILRIEADAGRQLLDLTAVQPGIYFLVEKRTGEKRRLVIF